MERAGKCVVILQSNYIPWKGYFDLIRHADLFVLYDDVQYTRRDWRNRNLIKTPQGLNWLTIPVQVKDKFSQRIRDTMVSNQSWQNTHWQSLAQNYSKAPFFKQYCEKVEHLYRSISSPSLSEINIHFLTGICDLVGIEPRFRWSDTFVLAEEKSERLAGICAEAGATQYLSGPAARDYLDLQAFEKHGIEVKFFDYSGYPPYPQLYGEFSHGVTILDLLFNVGPNSLSYLERTSA